MPEDEPPWTSCASVCRKLLSEVFDDDAPVAANRLVKLCCKAVMVESDVLLPVLPEEVEDVAAVELSELESNWPIRLCRLLSS